MTTKSGPTTEEFFRLVRQLEAEAYDRGWRDAIAAVTARADELRRQPAADAGRPETVKIAKPRGRPAKALGLVKSIITEYPGKTGVEIVAALESRGTPVAERTVRTCLRRLRLTRAIHQREGRWYPLLRSEVAEAKPNREVPGTPPH